MGWKDFKQYWGAGESDKKDWERVVEALPDEWVLGPIPVEDVEGPGDDVGEVDCISKVRLNGNGREFKVEWEDGKVSWEPESSLLQVRGTNKDARAARKEEMKEVAEELGNWEGLSWKEKVGAMYDGDEWEVLVGDEDGTVVEVKTGKR